MSPKVRVKSSVNWEDLDLGLPNDFDGYVRGAHFGSPSEEYAKIAGDAVALVLPLVSKDGTEEFGEVSYTLGKGWGASTDGRSVSHPTRKNFVKSSSIGDLIIRVVTSLKVPMNEFGAPTDATVWDGLGFHWVQEDYKPMSAPVAKKRLMPIAYLGEVELGAGSVSKPVASSAPSASSSTHVGSSETQQQLSVLAKSIPDYQSFVKAALKIKEVATDGNILAAILNEGPDGFYMKNKA